MTAPVARAKQTNRPPTGLDEGTLAQMIEELSARVPIAEQRIGALKTEREKLVIPARVDRDSEAQQRLRAIDEELRILERDLADDKALTDDLSKRLESTRKTRVEFEWEQRRRAIRKALIDRRDGTTVSRVLNAARALAAAIAEAKEQDAAVRAALMDFAPQWTRNWNNLREAGTYLERFAAMELADVLPIDGREVMPQFLKGRDSEATDRGLIDRVIQQLDDIGVVA